MLGSISRHGARVFALTEPLARGLGWDEQRIATLRLGALLHDVGKVRVRSELLHKTGPLTQDELAEIRTHPQAGADVILPHPISKHLLPYVLCHHERWDGDGYPLGLRGRAIPVEARLLAIADAFDAMTTPRPYRSPVSADYALAEIAACAGTQFDPCLAALFTATPTRRASRARVRSPRL